MDVPDAAAVNGAPPIAPIDESLVGSVGDRFVHVAAACGDRPALRSPAGTWTYTELGETAGGVADAVRAVVGEAEVRPVAVLADHDGPLVGAVLGIVLAGAAVLVIDPQAPAEQSARVVAECEVGLILHDAGATEAAAALGSAAGAPHVALGDIEPAPPRATARRPDDAVMLALTSGTTGAPKAAMITHGVITNLVRGATHALGIGPDDRMPMLFPVSLAVAAYPMFIPLLNGGSLSTLDVRSQGLDPIAPFLVEERITVVYMAPIVVRFLADSLAGKSFPDLRLVALGGELVDEGVLALTRDLFGVAELANGFGTTETGVISLHVMAADDLPTGPVPAGPPVPEVDLVILGDDGAPLPDGEAGEIAVVSPHLFAGYWGHPELSAQVLGDDPEGRPGWALYRSGDLGTMVDGRLIVQGRVDTKVKVRGRFVVLGDVEASVKALDQVADAVVIATTDDGRTELTCVVAGEAGSTLDPRRLREALIAVEETYRIPGRWVVVDAIPLLPNGKTDRRAAMALARAERPTPARTEPTVDVVRALRAVWESLLPVDAVGLDDDFTHLGGDSLLAAQMIVHVDRELGVTVPMGELVHARTLRQLAAVVERIRAEGDRAPSTAALVQPGDGSRPDLWFVHDLQGSAYRVRHLARHLGADQGVWSFESPLLRGEPNPYTALDTFAAAYVRDLRAVQPEGPYWLAGYSFGGVCAYEIARQLHRDGAEVAFVGVVDVGPGYRGPGWGDDRSPLRPWFGVAKPPPAGTPPAEAARFYARMARSSPTRTARHLMVRTGLSRLVDPLRFRADLRTHGVVRPEWRLWYAWEEHWKLASRQWPRDHAYAGAVDLFWADATPSADSTMGWGPLVDDLRVHRFAGDHLGVLEPRGAESLARSLRSALDAAGATGAA